MYRTLAIVGGRDFTNYNLLCKSVDNIIKNLNIKAIVSGGAQGADTLGERYAKEHNLKPIILKPEWDKYGKYAGLERNKDIVDNADIVIAFWDNKSKGTKNTIERTRKANKRLYIIPYNNKSTIQTKKPKSISNFFEKKN